ncbi:Apolipoprotein D [Triplophysa tibetana]|uniref:Apolipoprotein D n=1 Tax=Triplophysa tibetana TaxID=1572043 RepID=A0A5A9N4L4_9TELE|nr:Apolipoprotein D [Triplophysa tibetana]
MKVMIVLLVPLLVSFVSAQTFRWGPCPTPKVQPNFELSKYLGKWYEIERLPASFERGKCIEANYKLNPDKTIQVLNAQTYKGKVEGAEGTAVVTDMREPAKLGVRFSYFSPYAPYWVLSTDYNVALVYSCTDVLRLFHVDFAWILARTRTLPAETVSKAKETFSRENIDVSKMCPTDQRRCDVPDIFAP